MTPQHETNVLTCQKWVRWKCPSAQACKIDVNLESLINFKSRYKCEHCNAIFKNEKINFENFGECGRKILDKSKVILLRGEDRSVRVEGISGRRVSVALGR